jgi:hypothetical protein
MPRMVALAKLSSEIHSFQGICQIRYIFGMPRRPRANFYLNWVDDPKLRVRGWKIRVPYFDKGRRKYRRKLVSEFRYGGTKESLRAIAIRLRDKLIAELGTSTFGVACFQRQKSSRNTSGHIGVHRYVLVRKGEMRVIWAARWVDAHGKIIMKRFFAKHRGEEEAKGLAIRARAEGVRQTAKEISRQSSIRFQPVSKRLVAPYAHVPARPAVQSKSLVGHGRPG